MGVAAFVWSFKERNWRGGRCLAGFCWICDPLLHKLDNDFGVVILISLVFIHVKIIYTFFFSSKNQNAIPESLNKRQKEHKFKPGVKLATILDSKVFSPQGCDKSPQPPDSPHPVGQRRKSWEQEASQQPAALPWGSKHAKQWKVGASGTSATLAEKFAGLKAPGLQELLELAPRDARQGGAARWACC